MRGRTFRIRRDDDHPLRRQRTSSFQPKRMVEACIRSFLPLVCILCVAASLYFFLFSRSFSIDSVEIQAGEGIDVGNVKSIVYAQMDKKKFFIAPQRNIFLFDDKKIMQDLNALFAVDTLDIQKKMPNKLVVALQARPLRILWFSQEKLYDIDNKGVIVSESQMRAYAALVKDFANGKKISDAVKKKLGSSPPIIIDEENKESAIGETIASTTSIEYVISAKKTLEEIGIQPLYFKTKRNTTILTAVTSERWEVYMTADESLERQIASLQALLAEKIRDKRRDLRYIDARFGNRLYYTYK